MAIGRPASPRERLVNNEQVKLTASFLSRSGCITIIAAVVPIMFRGLSALTLVFAIGGLVLGSALNAAAFWHLRKLA